MINLPQISQKIFCGLRPPEKQDYLSRYGAFQENHSMFGVTFAGAVADNMIYHTIVIFPEFIEAICWNNQVLT